MGRFKYCGEIEEIKGTYWDLPADIHAPQARRYIEQLHAEEKALALEQQQAAIDGDHAPGAENADPGELARLREGLETLHQRLEAPDTAKAADAISSTARAMQSAWEISNDLQKLEAKARSQKDVNQALADSAEEFSNAAEAERKKTTGLIAANQKIVNNAFNSYATQIKDLRKQMCEAEYEISQLRTAAKDNKALVSKAARIVKAWEAKEGSE